MEPPPTQDISKSYPVAEDEQDKAINQCCSCCYDCSDSCFDTSSATFASPDDGYGRLTIFILMCGFFSLANIVELAERKIWYCLLGSLLTDL
ncbi:HTH myb-type domain-containing protein [Psidium guajava]|nr:HTH myb-type domain-containing protein [Psidium guajava]